MTGNRRVFAVIALAALIMVLFYGARTRPEPKTQIVASSAKHADVARAAVQQPPMHSSNVSRPATRQAPQPPALPFAYLGKLTEKGETAVVLHGGGRTLRVRGTGPLTDDYEVTAIRDDHLVLRYIPLGTEQVLELAARQHAITLDSPADSPQD